jgi:hypothetical protein
VPNALFVAARWLCKRSFDPRFVSWTYAQIAKKIQKEWRMTAWLSYADQGGVKMLYVNARRFEMM